MRVNCGAAFFGDDGREGRHTERGEEVEVGEILCRNGLLVLVAIYVFQVGITAALGGKLVFKYSHVCQYYCTSQM